MNFLLEDGINEYITGPIESFRAKDTAVIRMLKDTNKTNIMKGVREGERDSITKTIYSML